jgi:NADPH-dependent F420 reductase
MIGFIGGTGKQGRALAARFASKGYEVYLGSRTHEKSQRVVEDLLKDKTNLKITAVSNARAASEGEIIFVTLPYQSMKTTLAQLEESLRGKIVIDVINPLTNNNIHKGISASEELQRILMKSKVVCAFKNVSSFFIKEPIEKVEVDSLVCSDFEDAKKKVMELSESVGISAVDGGGLENALASELLTRLLLQLNKKLKAETGIKIVSFKD